MRTYQQGATIAEVVVTLMLIAVVMIAALFFGTSTPRCTSEKTLRDGIVDIVDHCPVGAETATPHEN